MRQTPSRFRSRLNRSLIAAIFVAVASLVGAAWQAPTAPTNIHVAAAGPAVISGYYSTSFTANENPISESSAWLNGGATGGNWTNVQTSGGLAKGTTVNNSSGPFNDGTAILTGTWSATQWATAHVFAQNQNTTGFQEVELRLRSTLSSGVNSGYEILFSCRAQATGQDYAQIVRWNGNPDDFTVLATTSNISSTSLGRALQTGDSITASISGSTITGYINGISIVSTTDSTFSSGKPGMGFWLTGQTTTQLGDCGMTDYMASDGALSVSNGSASDTQTKITAASSGDGVLVPAGSYTWSSAITISKKLILQAAGTVNVTCGTDASDLLGLTEATAGPIRVRDFTFISSTCRTNNFSKHFIRGFLTTNGRPIVIEGNTFNGEYGAIRMDTLTGLIANNTFSVTWSSGIGQYATTETLQAKCESAACETLGWDAGSTLGALDTTGEKNLYYEDNTIIDHNTETIDFDGNSRVVVRYNTFTQSGLTSHGNDTGPYGTRQWEIYNNTFSFSNPSSNCSTLDLHGAMDYFIYIRGGTGVITDNSIADINSCYTGDKAELKFADLKLTTSTGQPNSCWNGGYPSPRQHGYGLITGTAGDDSSGIYKGDSDPIYIWNNTGTGSVSPSFADNSPDQCGNGNTTASFVQVNRDYFLSSKSGYTKYTYPHPLRKSN